MNNLLDSLILTCAMERWQKVARMIALVADRAGTEPKFEDIAARIRRLVDAGKLEAKGDLARWGHSEVRLRQ